MLLTWFLDIVIIAPVRVIDKGELDPEEGGALAGDGVMMRARGRRSGHLSLLVFSRLSATTRQSPRGRGQRARRRAKGGYIWGYKTTC